MTKSLPTPSVFTVEEARDHFWICDGGQRVLLFIRMPGGGFYCNALFLRQLDAAPPVFPESYHSATAMGVQADIRWRWGSGWRPMDRAALELGAAEVRVVFTRHMAAGRSEQKIALTLRRSGTGPTDYVLHCRTELLAETVAGQSIEFLNFLPADVGNSWPDKKRFRATTHEIAPGVFERRPHTQVNVLERHYWPDGEGFRRPQVAEPPFAEIFDPARRSLGAAAPFSASHLFKPLASGGVLFFSGEEVTPAVRVLGTNTPAVLHTCDVWYDEHLCVERGVPQADGRFRYEAEYEIFRLPSAEAQRLTNGAKDVALSTWAGACDFAPFFCNRVNTFAVPAGREYDGSTGLFFAYENPADLVSWQRRTDLPERGAIVLNTVNPIEPPSGQHYQAVRYDLAAEGPWAETFPLGFALHLARGQTLEFSALIRTEGNVQARVEVREAFWGKFQREHAGANRQHTAASESVSSGTWTAMQGRITAEIPGSLSMVFLIIEGKGRAWFTELVVRAPAV